jgi:quercetin dioxygenase-like cupin family protein
MKPKFIPTADTQHLSLVGLDITVRARAADTGGTLTILEQVVPTGAGSPLHTVREDKFLTVLEGCVLVRLGAEEQRLGPGASAIIPRGTPHCFRNVEASPARFSMLITPGGHEVFLSELARLQAAGALTPAAMGEVAAHHGVAILPE